MFLFKLFILKGFKFTSKFVQFIAFGIFDIKYSLPHL